MPVGVQIIWAALLLVVLALLPFIVSGLHRAWWAARSIDRYFADMLTAAGGIAGNTREIQRLDDTIATASDLLSTAGSIHGKAETIRTTLASRVDAGDTAR